MLSSVGAVIPASVALRLPATLLCRVFPVSIPTLFGLFFLLSDAVALRRFFDGLASSSGGKSPSWEGAGDPVFSPCTFARSFRKSETTCCNRLLAYACRLRGAYDPAPESTSKKAFRLPCLFVAVA